jgi:hypothetical protein
MTSSDKGEIIGTEWIKRSQKGELCGVLGCMHPPTSQCSKCMNHYCSGHLDLHVHKVTDDEAADEVRSDKP